MLLAVNDERAEDAADLLDSEAPLNIRSRTRRPETVPRRASEASGIESVGQPDTGEVPPYGDIDERALASNPCQQHGALIYDGRRSA